INECYEKVKEKLKKLDSKEYKKIIEKELKKALKEIKEGYVMISRKEDEEIAKKYSLEVKGKIDCLGGMILKSKDGSKEIDLTFDFLLERKKDEIRIEIARNLFG
ncbi:MAG: V-type ATP synthase subunit E, partial [Thermoplasmata archaeon]|nr:V-type ATP synthase subunit E [Thermoplasmata archaeon]